MQEGIDVIVKYDHGAMRRPGPLPTLWATKQDAIDGLVKSGFRLASAGDSPEIYVTLKSSYVVYDNPAPRPQQHPERLYLPGADLESTETALKKIISD